MSIQIMKNKEAYFTLEQIESIIDYYWKLEDYSKAIFFLTLFRTGRRVSEILGKPPFALGKKYTLSNYKGLRPIDIYTKQHMIEFEILKKSHVKKKTKPKEEEYKKALHLKGPFRTLLPIDSEIYNLLIWYIEKYKILQHERLFQFSRFSANLFLKKACKECNIVLNLGKKKIRNKKTKEINEIYVKPHLHMFRHSYAIYVLKKNKNNPAALPMLKKLLQHSRLEVTEAYLQFTQSDTLEFVENTWNKTK